MSQGNERASSRWQYFARLGLTATGLGSVVLVFVAGNASQYIAMGLYLLAGAASFGVLLATATRPRTAPPS